MTQPKTDLTIIKQRDGTWSFTITWRGVTRPLMGRFTSQLQAQAAGMAAIRALESRARSAY
jgi:hypothetical protein